MSHYSHSVAVSVRDEDLNGVSSSVLKAESWLRTHVLAHFPASKITTIVVGNSIVCQNGQDHNLGLVLPSLKNIYHSLTRWGLEKDIKVSAAFPSNCIDPHSDLFRDDLAEKVTKPLLEFLHSANSTLSINLPQNLSPLSDEITSLVSSHTEFVKKFGSFILNKVNVLVTNPKEQKPLNRKLSAIDSKTVNPYPARPTPLPETSQPPLHSSIGFSVPANIAKNPLPPLAHSASPSPLSLPLASPAPLSFPLASPPHLSFPLAPKQPPVTGPANAPYGYSLPPCNPVDSMAPAPQMGVVQKLWCVAKPSVPAETLQEAMDFACGEGDADCEEIQPHGNCFYPDTVIAHASYAFNSYWQKTKRNGGTCKFGGTAMIINADPSTLF